MSLSLSTTKKYSASQEYVIEIALSILKNKNELYFYIENDRDENKSDQFENEKYYFFCNHYLSYTLGWSQRAYVTEKFLDTFNQKAEEQRALLEFSRVYGKSGIELTEITEAKLELICVTMVRSII